MTDSERTKKQTRKSGKGEPQPGTTKKAHTVLRWRVAVLVLCTIGAALSADLVRLHVRVHTDPDYHSYCAVSEWANCETVAESEQSVAFGLPVAVWGLLAYLAMGILAAWGIRRPLSPTSWPFGLLLWLSLISSAVSIYMYVVSHVIIESVCFVCMGTYFVNFALVALCWVELRRQRLGPIGALSADMTSLRERRLSATVFLILFVATAGALWASIPHYWEIEITHDHSGVPTGTTREGYPWIGAREPALVIQEYSDYQCPHCRRGHDQMRQLIQDHPEKIRLVHRQYPLDQACNRALTRPFHPFACAYAKLSYCAEEQGRFWGANDYLFANGRRKDPVTTTELAGQIGIDFDSLQRCMTSDAADRAIRKDLEEGRSLGIRGTPTFVIGDRIYPGTIPPEVLQELLE